MQFFDYANPLEAYDGNLPHWRQAGVPYFVTFRLADAIPEAKRQEWQFQRDNWHRAHHPPFTEAEMQEFHFLFSERVQAWLDAGHGACLLRNAPEKDTVAAALAYGHSARYDLDEWVIMPNHVHVIVSPGEGWPLERILHSWKSYTAHRINDSRKRTGQLWQHESYDHLVRSSEQLEAIRRYIRNNPHPR